MHNRVTHRLLILALTLLAACGDGSPTRASMPDDGKSTGTGTSGTITFLATAAGAPALAGSTVSFYAVQGKDTGAEIWYANSGDEDRLLRLRVRKRAQIVAPNGTALANGDSILVTITVTDIARMIVNFQPAGLRFLGNEAADLTLWYRHAHPDLNKDGVVNALDAAIESTLAIHRQESASAPWERLTSVLHASSDEIEALIGGFTNYVIAY